MFSSVVLPAPFGPTTPTDSADPSAKSTPSSTTSAPNRWAMPLASRRGSDTGTTIRAPVLAVSGQSRRNGDIGIVRVLADHEVDRVRGSRGRHPLTTDDRGRDHVWRSRPDAPFEVAERCINREGLHRRRHSLLVLGIAARLERGVRD